MAPMPAIDEKEAPKTTNEKYGTLSKKAPTAVEVCCACDDDDMGQFLLYLEDDRVDWEGYTNQHFNPLLCAAAKGREQIVTRLLEIKEPRPLDVNCGNGDNLTPLILAAQADHAGTVKILLGHPEIDPNRQDSVGKTALYTAARNELDEVIDALLNHPAIDVNVALRDGTNAMYVSAELGKAGVVGKLLAGAPRSIDTNLRHRDGRTALTMAVRNSHLGVVQRLIEHEGTNVNTAHNFGVTPLIEAAALGFDDILSALIDCPRTFIDKTKDDGTTALWTAVSTNNAGCATLLLEAGANPSLGPADQLSVLATAVAAGEVALIAPVLSHPSIDVNAKNEGTTPLIRAAVAGHGAIAASLLAQKDIDVNSSMLNGTTALYHAAQSGHAAIVNDLLSHENIKVNAASKLGVTPLFAAAVNGHSEICQALLAHADAEVNAADKDGQTALFAASKKGHTGTVDVFLNHPGIKANCANTIGQVPLHAAAENRHPDTVQRLLSHEGVDPNASARNGCTPLYTSAGNDDLNCVTVFLAFPSVEVDAARTFDATTPLYSAVAGHRRAVAAALLAAGADPSKPRSDGTTPLDAAAAVDDAALVAMLVVAGASPGKKCPALKAAGLRGDARAAAAAADGPGASPLLRSVLRGEPLEQAPPSSAALQADAAGLTPLYYAVELERPEGDIALIAGALGLAAGALAPPAARPPPPPEGDLAESAAPSGQAFFERVVRPLVSEGLCDAPGNARTLVSGYLGTTAAAVLFNAAPRLFEDLQDACDGRLAALEAPLKVAYTTHGVAETVGHIGGPGSARCGTARSDAKGLMPRVEVIRGTTFGSNAKYEEYYTYLLWLTAAASERGFGESLDAAVANVPGVVGVRRAAPKPLARMLSHLITEHKHEVCPRSAANVDCLRAAVEVDDYAAIPAVMGALIAGVGGLAGVDNEYASWFPAKGAPAHQCRALRLVLKYRAGVSFDQVFGAGVGKAGGKNSVAARKVKEMWKDFAASLPIKEHQEKCAHALDALRGRDIADAEVALCVEVEILTSTDVKARQAMHLHKRVQAAAGWPDVVAATAAAAPATETPAQAKARAPARKVAATPRLRKDFSRYIGESTRNPAPSWENNWGNPWGEKDKKPVQRQIAAE